METVGDRVSDDDRAVTELTAVATLVGLTVLLVLGIGVNVFLFVPDDSGEPSANFTFQHLGETNALLVTHEKGDPIPSDDLYIESEDGNATWTALAGWEESRPVEPGTAVQVSEGGAFGAPVRTDDRVSVVWRNSTANQSATLARWSGGSAL